MSVQEPMRFGLVGTGFWAREVHAPGVSASTRASLRGVWGRDASAASALAERHGAEGFDDFDAFLAQVDAVSFSVPPDVQAPLAAQAARAGKHLLLEKPIALSEAAGDELVSAVEAAGVAALVFFTHLFSPPVREWFDGISADAWLGGEAYWLGSALTGTNPFNTPWRRAHGGLWDVGPHAVVGLAHVLGPVVGVTATAGARDVTHLVLRHENGATSTCTLTLSAPDAADGYSLMLWGPRGRSLLPIDEVDSPVALTVAVDDLVDLAAGGERRHRADLRTGREVLRVLAEAQRQIDVGSSS